MQRLYHGCQFKNRNGTRREIDYKRGKICLVPTNDWCWRPTKMKYLERRPCQTRYRARDYKKVKSELEYKVKKAIYDTLSRVHNNKLDISTDFKILSIKDV